MKDSDYLILKNALKEVVMYDLDLCEILGINNILLAIQCIEIKEKYIKEH